jgi:hypothetical protein
MEVLLRDSVLGAIGTVVLVKGARWEERNGSDFFLGFLFLLLVIFSWIRLSA